VIECDGIGANADVRLKQRVTAHLGVGGHIIDSEHTGHRLLLQPLAGIPGGDARGIGQLGGGAGAVAAQRVVQAEAVAQIDTEQLERTGGSVEDS
jgi:hypothetical protein